jgi:guanyl-specific ribonuclease Sa
LNLQQTTQFKGHVMIGTRKLVLALAGVALLATAMQAQAQALTVSTTFTAMSAQAGSYTINFGASAVNESTSILGLESTGDVVFSGAAQGNQFQYTDGALFSNTALISGVAARPVGSTGNYLSVGDSGTSNGPSTLTFSKGLSYFGFLWGSPDTYNHVTFWNGDTQLASYDGNAVMAPPNGDQTYARFFNVKTVGNELITKVTFTSNGMAFETDNHAFVTAVPEPETYAMLLAGLGLMATVARRRKAKQA